MTTKGIAHTLRARLAAPRRRRLLATMLLALLLASMPLALLAGDRFTDVPSSNPYHNDIDAVADAGIMAGCNPPDNDKFCPRDRPTRDQLAGALARAAGLGGHPAVANADKVDGKDANGLVRTAESRGGGDLSDGTEKVVAQVDVTVPAAGFVMVNAAADANTLQTSGCPCGITLRLHRTGADQPTVSTSSYSQTLAAPDGTAASYASVGTTHVFPVTAAGTYTFQATMQRWHGDAPVGAKATITALYLPFGANGAGP